MDFPVHIQYLKHYVIVPLQQHRSFHYLGIESIKIQHLAFQSYLPQFVLHADTSNRNFNDLPTFNMKLTAILLALATASPSMVGFSLTALLQMLTVSSQLSHAMIPTLPVVAPTRGVMTDPYPYPLQLSPSVFDAYREMVSPNSPKGRGSFLRSGL